MGIIENRIGLSGIRKVNIGHNLHGALRSSDTAVPEQGTGDRLRGNYASKEAPSKATSGDGSGPPALA